MELDLVLVFEPDVDFMDVTFTILDDDVVEDTELVQLVLTPVLGERGVRFPEGGVVNGAILDDNDCKCELLSLLPLPEISLPPTLSPSPYPYTGLVHDVEEDILYE